MGGAPGHCYFGSCTAIYDQCLKLFNEANLQQSTPDECWAYNMDGDEWGNCGSNFLDDYTRCTSANQRCGKIQCTTGNSEEAILRHNWLQHRIITVPSLSVVCNSIDWFFMSIDVRDDFAYVRDGTWCDQDSFCHNLQCVHISQIPGLTTCPENCNGNGDCNSTTNQCECDHGFEEDENCWSAATTTEEVTTTKGPMTTTEEPTTTNRESGSSVHLKSGQVTQLIAS